MAIHLYLFIYNIRWIARLFPTVHNTLNLRDAARNEFERNMERRYDFRCRRKPKCSEKTCAGKYGSRTKFTYDSGPTGDRTRAALVKGTGTTAAPTCPPKQQRTVLMTFSHLTIVKFSLMYSHHCGNLINFNFVMICRVNYF